MSTRCVDAVPLHLMIIHLALERWLPANEALAEAQALGMDCELEQLRAFTESEVDQRMARLLGDVPSRVGTLPGRVGGG